MGVPHLYSWFKNKNLRGVLQRGVPANVSSLLFDLNGLIHNCAQETYAYGAYENPERRKLIETADPQVLEAEFYQVLGNKLSEIITQVQPRDTLVLAVDGVAPQAKIAQQRQRRYKAAKDANLTSVDTSKSKKDKPPGFSSNAITPGTEFMMRLDNFLQRWIVANQKGLPTKVIYSSHMVNGEGEHKILSMMRNGQITNVLNGSHVIYGMDADLIMLSLLAPLRNIFLMREDIRDVINIENLKLSIKDELRTETAIPDYVAMMFLIGNDFLPHMVTLADLDESIDTLMRIYKMMNVKLTQGDDINWPGFSQFLNALIPEEHRLLEMESTREVKFPSRMMEVATDKSSLMSGGKQEGINIKITSKFNLDVFRAAWYDNAFKLKGKNKDVFVKLIHNFGANNKKIVEMVKSYLTGIAWVFRYYKMGMEFINNDYVYMYHYAPLITDVALVAKQIGDKFEIDRSSFITNPNSIVINPVHQLLAVLPLRSKHLLPQEVQFLAKENSILSDYFPTDEIFERDGYNTDWQGVLLINFVDMARIIKAVNDQATFTYERLEQFAVRNDFILEKDPAKVAYLETEKKLRGFLQSEKRGRGGGRGYQPRSQREFSTEQSYQKPYEKTYEKSKEFPKGGHSTYTKSYERPTGRGRGRGNRQYERKEEPREDKRLYEKKPISATAQVFVPSQTLAPPTLPSVLPPMVLPPLSIKPITKPPVKAYSVQKFEL